MTYENGAYAEKVYNVTGQVEKIVYRTAADVVAASFAYKYDRDGNRTWVKREDGSKTTYMYDDLGRLTDEEKKNSGGTQLYRRQYSYDKVGNRTQRIRTDTGTAVTETLSYSGLGQVDGLSWTASSVDYVNLFKYDKNGNLTSKQETADSVQTATWSYDWDREDRMTRVRKWTGPVSSETLVLDIEYKYCAMCNGALSERIEKDGAGTIQSWLRYEYDGLNLLRIDQRYDSDSDGNAVIDESDPWRPLDVKVHGPGNLSNVARTRTWSYFGGESYASNLYPIYDALGNVMGVYTSGGTYLMEMDAFGNNTGSSWPSIDNTGPKDHLTGKMYDNDIGLYYFHARWYDPIVGRFVGRDKLNFSDNECNNCANKSRRTKAKQLSQNYNTYMFSINNPLRYTDVNGLEPNEEEEPFMCMFLCVTKFDPKDPDYTKKVLDCITVCKDDLGNEIDDWYNFCLISETNYTPIPRDEFTPGPRYDPVERDDAVFVRCSKNWFLRWIEQSDNQ